MKPVLIIAPLSTLTNWQREINLYTRANCALLGGSVADRWTFMESEFVAVAGEGNAAHYMPKFHILLTSYEMALSEIDLLSKINFSILIVDECQRLKNDFAQTRNALTSLVCDYRLMLSGTPIQNNVMELYSLLSFVEPIEFKDKEAYMLKFEALLPNQQPKTVIRTKLGDNRTQAVEVTAEFKLAVKQSVEELQLLLKKYLLRREKADVELSIPDKIETIIHVELTMTQKRYYRALLEKNRKFLCRGMSANKQHYKLGNILMELRKTCNHPYTLEGGRDAVIEDYRLHGNEIRSDLINDPIVASSGKFVLLHKLLPKLFSEKCKCLIFSQFVKTLDVIQEYLLKYHGNVFERIDGNIGSAERQAAINRFNMSKAVDPVTNKHVDNKSMVFLLTTRSGGVGINLQAANTGM